jgi:hypothetical protein
MSQPTVVYQSDIGHNISLLSAGVYRIAPINALAIITAGWYSWPFSRRFLKKLAFFFYIYIHGVVL